MKNLFKKSLLVLIGVLITSLTSHAWASITYDGNQWIYFNVQDNNWKWTDDNAKLFAVFDDNTWTSQLTQVIGDVYGAKIPEGTYSKVDFVRQSSSGTEWNRINDKTLESGKNYWYANGSQWGDAELYYYLANNTFYFDNSVTQWSTPYFRIGRTNHAENTAMTKVAGTAHLWSYTRNSNWENYHAIAIANGSGSSSNIYTVSPATKSSTNIKENITSNSYAKCTAVDNETYYTTTFQTSLPSYTVSYSKTGTGTGTLTVTKYNGSTYEAFTSGSSVYPTQIMKIVATPNSGSALSGLSISGATLDPDGDGSTYYVTGTASITATFNLEETHTVRILYKDHDSDDEIADYLDVENVGVTTTTSISPIPIDGYEFREWSCGTHVVNNDDDKDETIDINSSTCSSSCDFTITAYYDKLTRLSFTNPWGWSNIYAYVWDGTGNNGWTSTKIKGGVKDFTTTINCKTVYYFEFNPNTRAWENIIFHDGTSPGTTGTTKTDDLTIEGNDGKYYNGTSWVGTLTDYTVSVATEASYKGTVSGGGTARAEGCSAAISAEEKPGYRFDRWEVTSGTAEIANASSTTTTVTASEDATITAYFNQTKIIYFDNTMSKWDDSNGIWVYLFNNNFGVWYDDEINGGVRPGSSAEYGRMTRIGSSNIYYYKYSTNSTITGVAFAKADQHDNTSFYQTSAAWITNFNTCLPCYMASERYLSKNSTGYHSYGYWKRWGNTNSGFTLYYKDAGKDENSIEFTTEDPTSSVYTATVNLTSDNSNYTYNVARCNSAAKLRRAEYNGEIQDSDSDYPRELSDGANADGILRTSAAGTYNFTLSLASDHIMMTVEYPLSVGDYRVRLFNAVQNHPSGRIIRARTEERTDTVSFFIDHTKTNYLYIDTCTNTGNPPSWNRITDVAAATIELNSAPYNTTTGIYKFGITRTKKKDVRLVLLAKPQYDGNYYIRTDAANGKWDNYYTDPDNVMTYSDYSNTHCGYSHYFTNWVNKDDSKRKNVKFVIANDYSPCISDTLARETASGTWANIATFMEEGGDLKRSANVRFMWNIATNDVSRAYIDGAQEDGSEFLQLLSADSKIKQGETTKTEVTFNDNGNWIYEANVMAQPGAAIKLKSTWGEGGTVIEQYFKGSSESTETLIGGSTSKWYPIRLIYDFKTNRLVASYVPATGDISEQLAINADVMFIREHQGDIAQLTFSKADEESPMGAISNINTAYGVMRFNKWTLNNKNTTEPHAALTPLLTKYQRDLYWISFPFRVNLEEVFGFGTYGTHWIIEEYDGAGRAKNGFWADSPSFWRFITNRSGKILEPNTGYILALDLDELGESSSVWTNTDEVELYFPSYGSLSSITSSAVTYNIPEHTCGIGPRFPGGDDRRVKDSHWNVMSVPTYINTNEVSFANTTWITAGDGQLGPNFLYEWDSSDNSLEVRSGTGYTYHAMHAYMVQYCGNVTWTASVTPASIAARLLETQDREYKLVLQSVERTEDQTFVRLTDDENVTSEFEFNYDLSKEMNKNRGNIYTLISTTIDSVPSITEAAANMQPKPLQTTLVPVGVKVVANGEYTFSMPEGTNGENVYLIDNAYGTRTNLGLMPYTVTLTAGTYDSRFALEFGPIQDAPTGIEQMSTVNYQLSTEEVRKVFVGGRLYIIRDGKVYDAAGQRVE